MTELPTGDSLSELQKYIWHINLERGFNTEDPAKKMVMLMEEVGELAKAIRQQIGLKFTETTRRAAIAEELADVQIVLLGLASLLGEDMFQAVQDKERRNRQRSWQKLKG